VLWILWVYAIEF